MSERKRIGIGIHSYKYIDPEIYYNHLHAIGVWASNYNIHLITIDKDKVARARNKIVESSLKSKDEYLMFLDTDHIVTPELLPILYANIDKGLADVVSGLVVKTSKPYQQVGFIVIDGYYREIDIPLDGVSYKVDMCAFGCTLINNKVFEKMEKPYFRDTIAKQPDGTLWNKRSDVNFCEQVILNGGIVRIDTTAVIGHQGERKVYYPKGFGDLSSEFEGRV